MIRDSYQDNPNRDRPSLSASPIFVCTALAGLIVFEPAFSLDAAVPVWSWRLENNSPLDIRNVVFPDLNGLRAGPESARSHMAWPAGFTMIQSPPGAEGYRMMGYPGGATMAFVDLFDEGGGLYVAAYDPELWATEFRQEAPLAGGDLLRLSLTKQYCIGKGESTGFEFRVWPHTGDWHAGADMYRPFAEKAFGPVNPPERVRGCCCS